MLPKLKGCVDAIENGVHRDFKYTDMIDYIHNNVLPIVRVGAVSAS